MLIKRHQDLEPDHDAFGEFASALSDIEQSPIPDLLKRLAVELDDRLKSAQPPVERV